MSRAGKAARVVLLAAVVITFIVPIWWTLASALRPAGSLYEYANPLTWRTFVPETITFDNFARIFAELGFGRAMLNSVIVAAGTVLLGVLVSAMAGFALAKLVFPGKSLFFGLVLVTIMVPFEALVIPLNVVVRRLGIINSYWALILPSVGSGIGIFLFKQAFESLPSELLEAARIDGASWFTVFTRLVMPMSAPTVATAAVMMFLFQWNSLFWPLVATFSSRYQVVQVAVASNITADASRWATLFSSAVAASVPPMLLFLAVQRQYAKGITSTELK